MPHKHTRRKGADSSFDLAPTVIAKPLPAFTKDDKSNKKQDHSKKRKRGTKVGYNHDDTPRAFARLMQFQSTRKRPRSGLDDGSEPKSKKKRKIDATKEANGTQEAQPAEPQRPEIPKILPGERLKDYGARVDQALPVGNLTRKGTVKVDGLKERQTKTEKRLHKMYASWREDDARIKDKLEEEKELEEERLAEVGGDENVHFAGISRKGKRRKAGIAGDEDPWAELKAKREKPRGLHDVVQAPPSFKVIPKERFKVRNGARVDVSNVPAGKSLKRREELSEARKEVIERYRSMMGKKT